MWQRIWIFDDIKLLTTLHHLYPKLSQAAEYWKKVKIKLCETKCSTNRNSRAKQTAAQFSSNSNDTKQLHHFTDMIKAQQSWQVLEIWLISRDVNFVHKLLRAIQRKKERRNPGVQNLLTMRIPSRGHALKKVKDDWKCLELMKEFCQEDLPQRPKDNKIRSLQPH